MNGKVEGGVEKSCSSTIFEDTIPKKAKLLDRNTSALYVDYSVCMQVCTHVCVCVCGVCKRMLNNSGSGFLKDTVTRHHLIHLAPAN